MLSALAVVRSSLRSFGGDSSATTAPTSQGGGGGNCSSRRRGRRPPSQPRCSEQKQLRWNSCCSKTKIIVAPKPRPKLQPADERKNNERRNGDSRKKADSGKEAGKGSKAKKKLRKKVKKLTAKLKARQQRNVAAIHTQLGAQSEEQQCEATSDTAQGETANGTTREERELAKLKAAAEEATKKRNTKLGYMPGDWGKVPEQRAAEEAESIMQQIKEQEKRKSDIQKCAQKRMEREVKTQVTEHTNEIKALKKRLHKLLKVWPRK